MGLLLVARLVAVVTTAAFTEGLHNSLRLQPVQEGEGKVKWERGRGSAVLHRVTGESESKETEISSWLVLAWWVNNSAFFSSKKSF